MRLQTPTARSVLTGMEARNDAWKHFKAQDWGGLIPEKEGATPPE
jgi:hypothetical protein